MAYIARHMIRHNGKLYEKDEVLPLKHDEAEALIKHGAVKRIGKDPKPDAEAAPDEAAGSKRTRKPAETKPAEATAE